MKKELDHLMEKRDLDAIIVAGGEGYSDVRDYMSNGAHITGGFIVKKRGEMPCLVVNGMEIEEARKSGCPCVTYGEIGYYDMVKQYGVQDAPVLFWGRVLAHAGVHTGRVGVYGMDEINRSFDMYEKLRQLLPAYAFVGESGQTLFAEAYLTKDSEELARITSVAQRTNAVVEQVWQFISGHRAGPDGRVVDDSGTPLTVGDVKRFARRALLDADLEDTAMIFAPGVQGAYPHSRGEAQTVLRLGEAIVFDFFPREAGGGYCHDMTRTWCIGHASAEVQQLYDEVMTAFDIAVETYRPGIACSQLQIAVLDYFESIGHPTQRTSANPTEGYVHSLGHGIGLNIHENPRVHHLYPEDVFQVGNVVTIEPGLYYPDRGVGVRVEDTFVIQENGELVSITSFRKDLVLPLKG
jgi:Xaa-Pro aminopeptidase